MSREWQQKRYKQFVLPDAVYFQCLWAVRDLYRMEQRIEELEAEKEVKQSGFYDLPRVSDQGIFYGDGAFGETDPAAELQALKRRVRLIYEALDVVPEEYHENILGNIVLRIPCKAYPGKMWRYWKQRFLYALAKKFAMI